MRPTSVVRVELEDKSVRRKMEDSLGRLLCRSLPSSLGRVNTAAWMMMRASGTRLGRGPTPRARRFKHTPDLVARTPSASEEIILTTCASADLISSFPTICAHARIAPDMRLYNVSSAVDSCSVSLPPVCSRSSSRSLAGIFRIEPLAWLGGQPPT